MKLEAFERLKKMMKLTTSDVDAEALAAIRAANRVLADHALTWEKVFGKLVRVESGEPEVEAAPEERSERDEIRGWFDEIEESDPRGSFADFVADVKRQFERTGSLSHAQKGALRRAVERARSR